MTIRKIGNRRWRLFSRKTHRNLGTFTSEEKAKIHEREIQFFKRKGMEFPMPIELLFIIMVTVILGISVLIPILQDAMGASPQMDMLYQVIILLSVLFDVILIIAWLKF